MGFRKIAEERIQILFDLAGKRLPDQELADRYVELARKIGMKHQVSIPSELKRRFCSECGGFLEPGFNCTVRINSKKRNINYHCGLCGHVNRHGF